MTQKRAPRELRAVGLVCSLAFAFPGLYLIWRNFTSGADPFGLLFASETLQPFWRTVRLAILVSISAASLGTSLAWLTTRTDLPLRRLWRVVLPIPLVFPTFIGAAAFIRTLNPGGLANDLLTSVGVDRTPELRGLFGAWLVLTLFCYPYVYLPVAARLRQLPGSLEQSARILGDTVAQTFRRIVLRQISSSLTAGTLLVFLYTISDFGAVQLMRYDTLTRAIESNYLARPPMAFALSLILLVFAGAVVAAERSVSRRLPEVKVHRAQQTASYALGRWRTPAMLLVGGTFAFSIVAPSVALIDWAADGLLRNQRGGRPLTIDSSKVFEAATNTLSSSILTGFVALIAVVPIAFLAGRYRDRIGHFSHSVVIATFAVPGILIALSLRFWTLRSGFFGDLLYDTLALLIFAYVVRFAALAMGTALVAVKTVPEHLHDAAATLGADRWRRFRTVDLPVMRPGLLAASGLVVLSTMKELPISLIIAPIGFPTLTTRIFGSFEDAFVAEAGIMALVLVCASGFLSWILVLRRADHL
tara:strand:+ start:1754 stop:3346 length:1593 start_codon:yes stop_codon:yes gene_type:complete